MPEIVPPEPMVPFSVDAIMDKVWQDWQDTLVGILMSPGVLAFAAIGVAIMVAGFAMKRVLVSHSRKLMWKESWASLDVFDIPSARVVDGLIRGRIDGYMDVTWRRVWMASRRPRVHTACWYIAAQDEARFMMLVEASKDAEKFGPHLLRLAWKLVKDEAEDPLVTWRDLMRFADRSPEEHERLATPGYTLAESIISVEQDIPLEYAAALA